MTNCSLYGLYFMFFQKVIRNKQFRVNVGEQEVFCFLTHVFCENFQANRFSLQFSLLHYRNCYISYAYSCCAYTYKTIVEIQKSCASPKTRKTIQKLVSTNLFMKNSITIQHTVEHTLIIADKEYCDTHKLFTHRQSFSFIIQRTRIWRL